MYQILVLVVVFGVVTGLPLLEEQPTLNAAKDQDEQHQRRTNGSQQETTINPSFAKEALDDSSPHQNCDTKKHYYLLKIKEYYDFLPRYFSEREKSDEDRHLLYEIDDFDDLNRHYPVEDITGDSKTLAKRDAGDVQDINSDESGASSVENKVKHREFSDTVAEYIDVIQFVKRDTHVSADDDSKRLAKRDLGDFSPASDILTADSEDPFNNNYRYVAYIPFFKVRKYYIHRKRLDVGL